MREEVEPIVMREASRPSVSVHSPDSSKHLGSSLGVHNHQEYMAAVSAEVSYFLPDQKHAQENVLTPNELSESSMLACDALSTAEAARKSYNEWKDHAHHLNFILSKKKHVREAMRDAAPSFQPLHAQPWVGQQDGWSTYRYHPDGRDSVRPVSARASSARKPDQDISATRRRPASARPKLEGSKSKSSPYSPLKTIERILQEHSTERRAGAVSVCSSGGRKVIPRAPRRVRGWRETPVRNEAAANASANWRRNKSSQVVASSHADEASNDVEAQIQHCM